MVTTMTTRMLPGALVALLVMLLALTTTPARAHEEPAASEPEAGSTVAPPQRVLVRFPGELQLEGSTLEVLGPDGDRVDSGGGGLDLTNADRNTLVTSLPPDLPAGEYTVNWTAVSAGDGDTTGGTFSFTVDPDAPPAAAQAASPTANAELVAPEGTVEPAEDVALSDTDDDGGLGRGTLIVGALAIVVAVAVVATVGRRRWVR